MTFLLLRHYSTCSFKKDFSKAVQSVKNFGKSTAFLFLKMFETDLKYCWMATNWMQMEVKLDGTNYKKVRFFLYADI